MKMLMKLDNCVDQYVSLLFLHSLPVASHLLRSFLPFADRTCHFVRLAKHSEGHNPR